MAYVTYNDEFWREVSMHLMTTFGLGTGDENDVNGEEPLDAATLYVLAKAKELGVGVKQTGETVCWVGRDAWTPKYTASRLHRALGLR